MLIFYPDLGKSKILFPIPNLVLLKLILNMNECSHELKLKHKLMCLLISISLNVVLCEHTALANECSVVDWKRMYREADREWESAVNTEKGDNSYWGEAMYERKKQIVLMKICIGITWTNVMCKMCELFCSFFLFSSCFCLLWILFCFYLILSIYCFFSLIKKKDVTLIFV